MQKISVCIITFNEEKHIARCLESVKWTDEIIIVDSFSTDRTLEIARKYTDKIFQREWTGINDQRNYAMTLANHEWIFALDADEETTPELRERIKQILSSNQNDMNGFLIPRKTLYLGKWIKHGGWYPDYKLRLYKKGSGCYKGTDPHDHFYLNNSKPSKLYEHILHFTYEDIQDQIKTINNFSTAFAEKFLKEGRKFCFADLIFKPLWKFIETFFLKFGFLDGTAGFIISVNTAFYQFTKHSKLYELQNKR